MKPKPCVYLALHNIRSSENVGAIFRTADGAGISKIFLTGVTPSPVDRFGRLSRRVAKSALGAENSVPFEKSFQIGAVIKNLKRQNFQIVAIEQSANSVDYKLVKVKSKVLFVVGNEVKGLPESVLDKADIVAEIPMGGTKESLNVSVAAGIAIFRMLGI